MSVIKLVTTLPISMKEFEVGEWAHALLSEKIVACFNTNSLKGFGVEDMIEGVIAAGTILHYLDQNKQHALNHIVSIKRLYEGDHVWMDKFTIKNLELLYPSNENGISLLDVIDDTCTPMGSRMIKKWLLFPLKNEKNIKARLEVVDVFYNQQSVLKETLEILKNIGCLL